MSEREARGPTLGVVTNFFPSLTETFIYREVAGLRRRGMRVRVYSVRRPPEGHVAEEVGSLRAETRYLLPPRAGEFAAAHLRWLLRRPWRYLTTLVFLLFGEHFSLRDRLRTLGHFIEGVVVASQAARDGVGHLHGHYASHAATIALTAARLLGVPFSFTGHAYDIWLDRLLLPQKLRECRFAVTCTEAARRALLEAVPGGDADKVHTVYHGVDLAHFSPAEGPRAEGEPRILSVGRLDRQKGHHLLLEALGALHREGYRFRLTIVGSGPWHERLEGQAERLGIEERFTLAGRVFHEELPDYYRRADLFVLACFNDNGNMDNLPNVLLEAMACGVPVVSTRLQGIPELIEDGASGLLAPPEDVAGLTTAVRRLLDDHGLAARLGRAGRRRVAERFDLERSLSRLAALYGSQLGPARAGRRPRFRLIRGVAPRPAPGQLKRRA